MADGPFIRPERDPTGAPTMPAGGRGEPASPPEPESPDQLPGEPPRASSTGADPAAESPAGEQLPADPEAYDSPRAAQARARGLSAPYIAGGRDPEPAQGKREERRLAILLIAMIVIVVLLGFVLGVVQNLLGL